MVFDVGVIGGGVIGLSCAWRMAQAGARVAVFERGEIGREASWAAAGMLAAQCEAAHHPPPAAKSSTQSRRAMLDLCLQSRAMYAAFAAQLMDVTGVDIELSLNTHSQADWRTPGILYVDNSNLGHALDAFRWQKEQGLAVESVAAFRGFSALWLPDEGQVENRKLATALHHAAHHAGVTFFFGEARASDGVVHCGQESVTCGKIALCAGAWSGQQEWPEQFPVRPVAGQMLVLQSAQAVKSVIYSESVYLVPRRDGRLLVGATIEDVGFCKTVTEEGTRALWNAARELVPELANCEVVEKWAGLRPVCADGLPLLGATSRRNFYIASGHGRNGILLTPVTAALMTNCLLNNVEPPPAFSTGRFSL